MQILKVDKFLCCLELETGGKVLGWFGVIFAILGILGTIVGSFTGSISEHNVVAIALVMITGFVIIGCIKYLLIKGNEHANSSQILPAVILEAVACVSQIFASVGSLFYLEIKAVFTYAIAAMISFYCFICLYSLFDKTRAASNRCNANTVQQP